MDLKGGENMTWRSISNYDPEIFKPKKNGNNEWVCLNCGLSLAFNKKRKAYCSEDCKDKFFQLHYKDWTSVKYAVYERDVWKCKKCGATVRFGNYFTRSLSGATLAIQMEWIEQSNVSANCDHIIPLWKGGLDWTNDPEYKNLQTLCAKCHRKKTSEELKERTKKRLSMDKQESLRSCIEK
jgi:5-methylcytosine-specific restriction endonuclease McrA